MQQRKSGVSDSADKLPLANPRHRWLGRRGSNLRHISSIRRLAPPKHSEPTSCRQHRRRCFRLPNIAPTAIARGEECCWRTAKMLFARSQVRSQTPRAARPKRAELQPLKAAIGLLHTTAYAAVAASVVICVTISSADLLRCGPSSVVNNWPGNQWSYQAFLRFQSSAYRPWSRRPRCSQ